MEFVHSLLSWREVEIEPFMIQASLSMYTRDKPPGSVCVFKYKIVFVAFCVIVSPLSPPPPTPTPSQETLTTLRSKIEQQKQAVEATAAKMSAMKPQASSATTRFYPLPEGTQRFPVAVVVQDLLPQSCGLPTALLHILMCTHHFSFSFKDCKFLLLSNSTPSPACPSSSPPSHCFSQSPSHCSSPSPSHHNSQIQKL